MIDELLKAGIMLASQLASKAVELIGEGTNAGDVSEIAQKLLESVLSEDMSFEARKLAQRQIMPLAWEVYARIGERHA